MLSEVRDSVTGFVPLVDDKDLSVDDDHVQTFVRDDHSTPTQGRKILVPGVDRSITTSKPREENRTLKRRTNA